MISAWNWSRQISCIWIDPQRCPIADTGRKEDMKTLKELRTIAGMSQSQLSEKSGVNLRMVQYYEQGVKDIKKASGETILKLARALGCSMEEIIE